MEDQPKEAAIVSARSGDSVHAHRPRIACTLTVSARSGDSVHAIILIILIRLIRLSTTHTPIVENSGAQ